MLKWLRDVVLVPILIAFLFMIWGAWYTGVKWHSPFSSAWLGTVLTAPIPLWLFLAVLLLGTVAAIRLFRSSADNKTLRMDNAGLLAARPEADALKNANDKLESENESLERELAKLKGGAPQLHGVWNNSHTIWCMARKGAEPTMQVVGRIALTSSNTHTSLQLLAAYIDGQRADTFLPVTVPPYKTIDAQVAVFMLPPLETDPTKPFTATIVLEDQKNRRHELPRQEFRPSPPIARPTGSQA